MRRPKDQLNLRHKWLWLVIAIKVGKKAPFSENSSGKRTGHPSVSLATTIFVLSITRSIEIILGMTEFSELIDDLWH